MDAALKNVPHDKDPRGARFTYPLRRCNKTLIFILNRHHLSNVVISTQLPLDTRNVLVNFVSYLVTVLTWLKTISDNTHAYSDCLNGHHSISWPRTPT